MRGSVSLQEDGIRVRGNCNLTLGEDDQRAAGSSQTFQVALRDVPLASEHHCTSLKRTGIAKLAPPHVRKSEEKCEKKKVGSYLVGPRGFRIDGDEEDW